HERMTTTDVRRGALLTLGSRRDHVFPTLTAAQIARVRQHGQVRALDPGDILVDPGTTDVPLFVITAGEVEITRPSAALETLITVHGPGSFTGEATMLSGRRTLFRARVSTSGEAIELCRERLLELVQTDAELSEIFMRAFILRRVELIASGLGDVVLIGSTHSPGTLRIKEFLTRNGHPYAYIDLDKDPGIETLLDGFHVSVQDVPVVICRGDQVLRNPSNEELAQCLGFNAAIN